MHWALRTPERRALFLNARGLRIKPTRLTDRLHRYLASAGIEKPGSVHIFRHTMATLMHDGGADIRDLQEMLGHAQLSTTEIYTYDPPARPRPARIESVAPEPAAQAAACVAALRERFKALAPGSGTLRGLRTLRAGNRERAARE